MMDQNRCLLDVIDNPQLLQSFLETESIADPQNASSTTASSVATSTTATTTYSPPTTSPSATSQAADSSITYAPTTTIASSIFGSPSTAATALQSPPPLLVSGSTEDAIDAIPPEDLKAIAETTNITTTTTAPSATETAASETTLVSAPSHSIDSSTLSLTLPSPPQPTTKTTIPETIKSPLTAPLSQPETITLAPNDPAPSSTTATTTTTPTISSSPSDTPLTPSAPITPAITSNSTTTIAPSEPYQLATPVTTSSSSYLPVTTSPSIKPTTESIVTTQATDVPTTCAPTPPKTTKRAPKKSTPRQPRGKNANANVSQPSTTSILQTNATNTTPIQPQYTTPMQTQYTTTSVQPPNNGIRQMALLAPPNLAMGAMPQQQRVIQIQTANGPMYFAIAPQPVTVPTSRPVVPPSSQPMMMPRGPGQILLNRPMGTPGQMAPGQILINRPMGPPGQLMPGQQQFIQVQTPNGPMLLALPTQQPTMIDYNNQQQPTQQQTQQQTQQGPQQQQQQMQQQPQQLPHPQQQTLQPVTSSAASKPGPDLGDLLLDCGILPEDKTGASSQQQQPTQPTVAPQPQQQQPIRITIGPGGQMMMQPTVYGAIRPVLANPMGQMGMNPVVPGNLVPSSSPMMMTASNQLMNPSNDISNTDNNNTVNTNNNKKTAAKGKTTGTKRSRSKKSDLDKFPTLKTPNLAQQQQQHQQIHQQISQEVVPMTMLVGDQGKVIAGSEVRSNVAQLGVQPVSIAKIVTPVMQTSSLQPLDSSNMIQTSIQNSNLLAPRQFNSDSTQNIAQLGSDPNAVANINAQNHATTSSNQIQSSTSHMSSSDTLKIDQNGAMIKTLDGQTQGLKAIQTTSGVTALIIQHPAQLQQNNSQKQQAARQIDLRAQSILNQLAADQNAAMNPQINQSFRSVEDACKRLLRYHVFDTETASEAHIKNVDNIFEAAAENLLSRKQALYDKYRLMILKQSMKNVPSSEEVMLEQAFVSDEIASLKREKELFREYEAQLDSMTIKQAKLSNSELGSNRNDCTPDYFAFGNSSPKPNSMDDIDNASQSRDDDWLMADKWGKSRYPSVPDSEAATAIESILNDELS